MDKFEEKLKQAADEHINLSERERASMRTYLLRQMQRVSEKQSPASRLHVRSMTAFLAYLGKPVVAMALVVLVVIGGVTTASAHALPGSPLYPVKVGVIEEVQGVFHSGDKKVAWEAERASRRLYELQVLSSNESSDPETVAQVAEKYQKHISDAQQKLIHIKERDEVDGIVAQVELESRLAPHLDTLTRVSSDVAEAAGDTLAHAVSEVRLVARSQAADDTGPESATDISVSASATVDRDDGTVRDAESARATRTERGVDIMMRTMVDEGERVRVDADISDTSMRRLAHTIRMRATDRFERAERALRKHRPEREDATVRQLESELEEVRSMFSAANRAFEGEEYRRAYDHYLRVLQVSERVMWRIRSGARFTVPERLAPVPLPKPAPDDVGTRDEVRRLQSDRSDLGSERVLTTHFSEQMQARVIDEVGQPIEGFEPHMFLRVFPRLHERDFDGVEAQLGTYVYRDGELTFQERAGRPLHSAARAITRDGMERLLEQTALRLRVRVENTTDVNVLVRMLAANAGRSEEADNNAEQSHQRVDDREEVNTSDASVRTETRVEAHAGPGGDAVATSSIRTRVGGSETEGRKTIDEDYLDDLMKRIFGE